MVTPEKRAARMGERFGKGWLNWLAWAFLLLNPITAPGAVVALITGRE